ncbi:hypothetical protein L2E82_24481 [Cichorium intybus]|uniref:Uncharacterized protein n=1 Tax=Cichorium intybus TaxID=13427 RepID=A0ACB9E1M3_CICIN|nr:hypothetical protein L2E82_24481 [Cichorium intybus]
MIISIGMEVNDTKLDPLPPTLSVLGSDFVYNDDVPPVPLKRKQWHRIDALPLTLQPLGGDFVYTDDNLPVSLTIDESSITTKSAYKNISAPRERLDPRRSPGLSSTASNLGNQVTRTKSILGNKFRIK